MLHDLTIDDDTGPHIVEQETREENLPGSCKTMYALNFRMGLDEKERDFAQLKPKPVPIRVR